MPSIIETAKEATYTAIGLNVLFFDEVSERFSEQRDQVNERFSTQREDLSDRLVSQRNQLNEQLDIARDHAKTARTRMVPVARRTWEAAEPAVNRISDLTPAPFDTYVTDGITKIREFVGEEASAKSNAKTADEPVAEKAPEAKKAATKAASKK